MHGAHARSIDTEPALSLTVNVQGPKRLLVDCRVQAEDDPQLATVSNTKPNTKTGFPSGIIR